MRRRSFKRSRRSFGRKSFKRRGGRRSFSRRGGRASRRLIGQRF